MSCDGNVTNRANRNDRIIAAMKNAWFAAPLALLLLTTVGSSQQKVPFDPQLNIPVAPKGLAGKPLPVAPVMYDTAEGQKIRVTVVTKALEHPMGAVWLPDGTMLVIERAGRLRAIRKGVLDPKPIAGGPTAYSAGESGLPGAVHGYMDIKLD